MYTRVSAYIKDFDTYVDEGRVQDQPECIHYIYRTGIQADIWDPRATEASRVIEKVQEEK